MKIAVLGAGAWGTALATLLARSRSNQVTIWGHDPQFVAELASKRCNERFLPGVQLPPALKFEPNAELVIGSAECIVVAVPSKAFREVASGLRGFKGLVVSVTKGIEFQSGATMCGILDELVPQAKAATLSGPSFAIEVASGIPTAVVAAAKTSDIAEKVQTLFNQPTFRVYTSTDRLGVELGGALKNVIAIAAGIGDGLGYGDNTKAALVTRAIAEMRRLGTTSGAQAETFNGLSGQGDLVVTCFSRHSRNRGFGERIGKGEKATDIAASTAAVAEGFPTARSAYQLAKRHGVETPIIDEVYAMLYEGKDVCQAVHELMTREPRPEVD